MKVVDKKLNKAQIVTICLLIASVLLLSAYLIISAIAKKMTNVGTNGTTTVQLELKPGESQYLGQPIAYPAISESQILLLQVSGPNGKYDISRYPDDQGSFMLHYYVDGQSEAIPYIPPIYGAEEDFDYESLYAIEQNDGYGRIYYLTYLCSALGIPYFRERIDLPSTDTEEGRIKRDLLLSEYGLTQSESTEVSFVYGERDPKTGLIIEESEKTHRIAIGKRALSGTGFYFMVDGRDCVYYTGTEYFKYALAGFHEFVKGMLVAEGIESDSAFGPYLTTDFKTWVGQVYEEDYTIKTYTKTESDNGYENPEVIVTTDIKRSFDSGVNFIPEDSDFNGYDTTENTQVEFDLEELRKHPDFARIEAALKGKKIGTGDIVITLFNELYNSTAKNIVFENGYGDVTYKYTVYAIESVIGDLDEKTVGTVSDTDKYVKITYRYTIGDNTVQHDCHAVVALSDLSEEDRGKIVGQNIGKLDTPIDISVTYTKDVYVYTVKKIEALIIPGENGAEDTEKTDGTVLSLNQKLRVVYSCEKNGEVIEGTAVIDLSARPESFVTDGGIDIIKLLGTLAYDNKSKFRNKPIGNDFDEKSAIEFEYVKTNANSSHEKLILTEITTIFDENAMMADVITEKSYVTVSYYRVFGSVVGDTETMIIRLCDILDTDKLAPLKTELLGKGRGKLEDGGFEVYDDTYYYEFMRDFVCYEISNIDYAVVNELIVSFRFCNASERDPYYGDTFFENTLKNKYKLYGLNADACEQVVAFLGGLGTTTNTALGLSGETVAVGLTVENMQKYGLYAHRIYFELPRGIYDKDEANGQVTDGPSDYAWFSTLGFTLYISEAQYDENNRYIRYIGSDMYDLIAKVDATNFDFLEKGFVEFWARRNLMMMSISNVESLTINFNMANGLEGSYAFDVYFESVKYEGYDAMDEQRVTVTPSENAFETKLTEFMKAVGKTNYGLTTLYNKTMGDGKNTAYYEGSFDTLGTAYFNSVYEIVQLTRYQGMLTVEEQSKGLATEAIFSIHLAAKGKNDETNYYTYDFHRLDDRRIMVSLYRSDADGNKLAGEMQVSDFYITTFAFKKIVGNYIKLLNGEKIDSSIGYPI